MRAGWIVLACAWIGSVAPGMAASAAAGPRSAAGAEPVADVSDSDVGPDTAVAATIRSLQGHSKAQLSEATHRALDESLEADRTVLLDRPGSARDAIREVLASELKDSLPPWRRPTARCGSRMAVGAS